MKHITWLIAVALIGAVVTVGCSKKGVSTSKLESSFSSAEPATKSDVDKAVEAVNAGKYSEAMAYLNKVASKAQLTPEQEQAIKDVIAQLQKQIEAQAGQAAGEMQKSAEEMQKSLPIGK